MQNFSPGKIFSKNYHYLRQSKNMITMYLILEFELIFKGSDALERNGAFYAISQNDHPVTKLLQQPYKAQKGTNVLISLNVQQVRQVVKYKYF